VHVSEYCRMSLTDVVCELLVDLLPARSVATVVRMNGGELAECPEWGGHTVFGLVRDHLSESVCTACCY